MHISPRIGVGRVHSSGAVVGNQPGDSRRVEQAAPPHRRRGQRVVHELPQIVPQPPAQRRAEAGFGAMDDLGRQMSLDRLLQHPFAMASALLHMRRQRIRQADEIVVEERHAHFDAGRHRHLVRV